MAFQKINKYNLLIDEVSLEIKMNPVYSSGLILTQ